MKLITLIILLVGGMLRVLAMPCPPIPPKKEGLRADSIVKLKYAGEDSKTAPGKMTHSLHPVRMSVVGNTVKVQSPENQILPIYSHNGTFYLIMRLNKGINWLNGLPKGRYYINSELITIK